jgi:hypothetical protein
MTAAMSVISLIRARFVHGSDGERKHNLRAEWEREPA